MRIVATLLLAGWMLGLASAQDAKTGPRGNRPEMETKNVEVMLKIFRAIEQRDRQSMMALIQPDVKLEWPPSLPYGDRSDKRSGWGEVWGPLQPTDAERRMDPRVIGAGGDEVVILWRQRGLSPVGERFDSEVLGLYRLREGKLARAQMFYFDEAGVAAFLARAQEAAGRPK